MSTVVNGYHIEYTRKRGQKTMAKTIITTKDGRNYERVSRWIKIENRLVTKRHILFDYADTLHCSDDEGMLTCFRYHNKLYAIGQFMWFEHPEFYYDSDGKEQFLCGYDCTQWYKPLCCEIDDSGEHIRLYEELDNNI